MLLERFRLTGYQRDFTSLLGWHWPPAARITGELILSTED